MARIVRPGVDPPGDPLGAGEVPPMSFAVAAIWGVIALLCASSLIVGLFHLPADPLRGLVAVPVEALLVYGMVWTALREVRHAAWLDGTVLYVRGPFRIRCCDLATARDLKIRRVSMRRRHAGPAPVLIARNDDAGRSIHYPLVATDGTALSHDDRVRVAEAIEAGAPSTEARATTVELRKRNYLDVGRLFR